MRKMHRVVAAFALCLLLCAGICAMVDQASAQDAAVSGDKEIATREGVSESLGNKEWDKDQLPGKGKIGFAFGSIIAMIAVIKYL